MSRPRLLLADDHRLVLDGLQRLLEPEFDVVGAVEDGRSLVSVARRFPMMRPDETVDDRNYIAQDGRSWR